MLVWAVALGGLVLFSLLDAVFPAVAGLLGPVGAVYNRLPDDYISEEKPQFRFWCLTLLQSSVSSCISFYILAVADIAQAEQIAATTPSAVAVLQGWILGHLLYDFWFWARVTVLRPTPGADEVAADPVNIDSSLVLHHLVSVLGIVVVSWSGNPSAVSMVLLQCLHEINSPLISLRVLFWLSDFASSIFNIAVCALLPLGFLLCHCVVNVYTIYSLYYCKNCWSSGYLVSGTLLIGILVTTVLGGIWTTLMTQRIISELSRTKED